MTIAVGDKLPQGKLLRVGANGPEAVDTAELSQGRVALFGVPGAFTGTCTNAHMPSFVRSADAFRAKGVSRIVCITVNDPFVAKAWADQTGATEAGIDVAQVMGFSVLVLAGASQFSAVQLLSDHAPVLVVLASSLAINLRMAMYSASLTPWLGAAPAWHLYPLRVPAERRRAIFEAMREQGIGVQVNYIPVYWHPLFEDLGYRRGMCPNAEQFYAEEISLPMHAELTDSQLDQIIEAVKTALA